MSGNDKKKVVMFRPGELSFRAGTSDFYRTDASVFADGYDMFREGAECESLSSKEIKSANDLARLSEYEARSFHLTQRIIHKLNISGNAKRGVRLSDFNVVVREPDSLDMPSFGSLEPTFEDSIELNTKDAARMLIGVPKKSREYSGYPGVKQGINALAAIWAMSDLDNPFVDMVLLEAEQSMVELENLIENKYKKLELRFANVQKMGMTISVMKNPTPERISVQFKSPYGFGMLMLVASFDQFVCLAYTMSFRGVITQREYKDILHEIKNKMISFCIGLQTKRVFLENEVVKEVKRYHWLSHDDKSNSSKYEELLALIDVLRILPPNDVRTRDNLSERSKRVEKGVYSAEMKARLIEANAALATKFNLNDALTVGGECE